jgi:hypothetical protein
MSARKNPRRNPRRRNPRRRRRNTGISPLVLVGGLAAVGLAYYLYQQSQNAAPLTPQLASTQASVNQAISTPGSVAL